jgi:uncharacterized protein (DUF362 family)
MPGFTRRSFVRRMALGLGAASGGWLLNACGQATGPSAAPTSLVRPTSTPAAPVQATSAPATQAASAPATAPASTQTQSPTGTSAPADTATAAPASTTTEYPYLVVARGGDNPEELVNRALAALGGIEQFVKPGHDVIIKPNICVAYHSFEYAATTNPWVVGALVKLCKGAGAGRVRVFDFPFGGSADEAYTISGIREQVLAAGGEMEQMSGVKFVKTDIPNGLDIKDWRIYEDVLKADVVINVPIAKTHGMATLTLGMKNLLGVVQSRESMHRNMGQRVADLTSRVRPTLTVIDAVRALMANGPTGGDLNDVKKFDTVIASRDVVAADSYATGLFGLKPDDIAYITAGATMGLGRSDLAGVKIEEIAVGG